MNRTHKLCRWVLAPLALVWFSSTASALDPNRVMSQYVREQWTTDRGIPRGHVLAIAQTGDGYLWIGTDSGLVRFDGFSFHAVSFFPIGLPSNAPVLGLITDADGSLVVRLPGAVVLLKSDGKFVSLSSELGLPVSHVTAIWKEEHGQVLFSDLVSGTVRFQDKRAEVLALPSRLPGAPLVTSLAETPDGKIWMGTLGAGLFYVTQRQVTKVTFGLPERKINCMLSVANNELWVGTDRGLFYWNGKVLTRGGLPARLGTLQVLTMLQDRESNVWVGTARGLLRINAKGISFSDESSLGGNGAVNALFEDREGNLWVGGTNGLERIRDSAFVTYSQTAGLPSERNGPVYADTENRIWSASTDGGLYWFRNGHAETVQEAGLARDEVYAIAGKNGDIWVGRQRGGLTRLRHSNSGITSQTYTTRSGLVQNSVYAVYESHDGAVWAGTLSGGISRFKDGQFSAYTTSNGITSNTVNSILETDNETMWFATSNGISSLSNGKWKSLTASDGLPSNNVNCLFEDSAGTLWIGTSEGLALLSGGHVQIPDRLPESLRGQIFGMAEDKNGWFWIATANHVLRVRRDTLITGEVRQSDLREYGSEDGLLSSEGVKRNQSVVSDPSGRIWFSLSRGLSVADPSHLTENSAPAIPHVEGISVDGSPLDAKDSIRVSASQKRITFRYTGLSLAAPERIRFRYFLEGFDRTWSEPIAEREAVYTNLNAGPYRFRLMACNSDGLWNGAEASLQFEIEPVFWKTRWFVISFLVAFLVLLSGLYQIRLRQLHRQFNIGLEARVDERIRIARELHDTLLQSLHGLMFQFQAARNMLPQRTDEAIQTLDGAITATEQAIAEGRGAIRDLRVAPVGQSDLTELLSTTGQELANSQDKDHPSPAFKLIVEGERQTLPAVVQDEVYRIAREILRNAFQHAQADQIETEIRYDDHALRLRIRDDGKGIDPKVLNEGGSSGHWGLRGIRERAQRIGARLDFWSETGAGTEVELMVPGKIAYEKLRDDSRFTLFRKAGSHEQRS